MMPAFTYYVSLLLSMLVLSPLSQEKSLSRFLSQEQWAVNDALKPDDFPMPPGFLPRSPQP